MIFFVLQSVHQDELTALVYASGKGYTDVVKLLIDAGANIDAQDKVRSVLSISTSCFCTPYSRVYVAYERNAYRLYYALTLTFLFIGIHYLLG